IPVGWAAEERITQSGPRESGKSSLASQRRQAWQIRLTRPVGALNSPESLPLFIGTSMGSGAQPLPFLKSFISH
ncbi:hypothetical protein, partial [Azospirillum sp.]|uniref:hypothetical protein n=1 Tax=Azospirillum sp. TaxID=34012 RepID=UPI002D43FC23